MVSKLLISPLACESALLIGKVPLAVTLGSLTFLPYTFAILTRKLSVWSSHVFQKLLTGFRRFKCLFFSSLGQQSPGKLSPRQATSSYSLQVCSQPLQWIYYNFNSTASFMIFFQNSEVTSRLWFKGAKVKITERCLRLFLGVLSSQTPETERNMKETLLCTCTTVCVETWLLSWVRLWILLCMVCFIWNFQTPQWINCPWGREMEQGWWILGGILVEYTVSCQESHTLKGNCFL